MVNEFEEFRKQYEKTFIRVLFESKPEALVVLVRACISDDEESPYIVIQHPSIGQCTLNWNASKQTINYDFPSIGLFNYKDQFMMFHRFPERQWKRGITASNSLVVDPFKGIFACNKDLYHNRPNIGIDFDSLSSAFSNKYPTNIMGAIEELTTTDTFSKALNTVFGVSRSPVMDNRLILWKHLNMIGYVIPEDKSIIVVETIFRQEVFDFLKRAQEFDWSLK